jgi:multiple sugar transport system permease protein
MNKRTTPWLLLAPALLITGLYVLFPVAQALSLSLHYVNLFHPRTRPFVGLANYINALADPVFWHSLFNSFLWVFGSVSMQFLLGLGAALLLNRSFAWRGVARALVILPWALPSVIIGLIWTWMLDFNLGIVNELGIRLGLIARPIAWLSRPDTAMIAVMLAVIWQGFPFFAVTLLAGLQGIPADLYEAAALDGASAPGKFWHVTLPGLAGVIATALLLRMIWVANSLDLILVMTGGGPGTTTLTLPLHAMLTAWSGGDYGKGSALAVLLTLILLGGMIFSLARKREP